MYIKGVFPPGKSASSLALVRTKYNVVVFCLFDAVRYHTALFASEPETVNEITHVLMVIHSLVYPFNRTRERTETTSSAFAHPSAIAVFTPAQKIRTKGGKRTWVWFNQDRCESCPKFHTFFILGSATIFVLIKNHG